jgi:hypothetical protein
LLGAKFAVELAINGGMNATITASLDQLDKVQQSIYNSTAPATSDIKDSAQEAEASIRDFVDEFNDTVVNQLNIAGIQEEVRLGLVPAVCLVVSLPSVMARGDCVPVGGFEPTPLGSHASHVRFTN